jgi:pSer/pThr/pTyr-binding forkhead associated (FHA) protein
MATLAFFIDPEKPTPLDLGDDIITVGRHPDSIVEIDEPSVSGKHAIIEYRNGNYWAIDQGSRNGTRVNSVRISERLLKDQDEIAFGDVICVYFDGAMDVNIKRPQKTKTGAEPIAGQSIPAPRPFVSDVERKPTTFFKKIEAHEQIFDDEPSLIPTKVLMESQQLHVPSSFPAPLAPPPKPKAYTNQAAAPSVQSSTASGCLWIIVTVFLMFTVAITGMYLKHQSATGGNLFKDILQKIINSPAIENK